MVRQKNSLNACQLCPFAKGISVRRHAFKFSGSLLSTFYLHRVSSSESSEWLEYSILMSLLGKTTHMNVTFSIPGTWWKFTKLPSIQFSSVTQSCPTLYNPMNPSKPGLPVHHQLPEFTQTHVYWVSDDIRPSHPLSSSSPPAPSPSQHQGPFQWVSSSHEVAKVVEFQLQRQSFQCTPRTGLL